MYSNPSLPHKVATGMHPKNPFVKVEDVATVLSAKQLKHQGPDVTKTKVDILSYEIEVIRK
ncbi:MAG: hypothetical protein KDD50_10415 [Bdellovibrionales bacterium]|nr:hypothetical protein [Bdellovibrionales bacterium]